MKKNYIEFSRAIKEQYPEYKDIDDEKLAYAMIERFPVYADQIDLLPPPEGGLSDRFTEDSGYSPVDPSLLPDDSARRQMEQEIVAGRRQAMQEDYPILSKIAPNRINDLADDFTVAPQPMFRQDQAQDVFSLPGKMVVGGLMGAGQAVGDAVRGYSPFGGFSEGFVEGIDPNAESGNAIYDAITHGVKSPVTGAGLAIAPLAALPALGSVATGALTGVGAVGAGLALDPAYGGQNALMDVGLGAGLPMLGPALGALGRRSLGKVAGEFTEPLVEAQGRLPIWGTKKPADVAMDMRREAARDIGNLMDSKKTITGLEEVKKDIVRSVSTGSRSIADAQRDLGRIGALAGDQTLITSNLDALPLPRYKTLVTELVEKYGDIPELPGVMSQSLAPDNPRGFVSLFADDPGLQEFVQEAMWTEPMGRLTSANRLATLDAPTGLGTAIMDFDVAKPLKSVTSLFSDIGAPKAIRMLDTYGTPGGILGAEAIRGSQEPESYVLPPLR